MFYLEVFRAMDQARVRYLVAGGVAMNLHGVPRMTADLDLVVALDPVNVRESLRVVGQLGFLPSIPVSSQGLLEPQTRASWIRDKKLIAFPFHNPKRPYEAIDFLIDVPLDFEAAWERRLALRVEEIAIPVLALEDLIALKKIAGRGQDKADVEALVRLAQRMRGGRG